MFLTLLAHPPYHASTPQPTTRRRCLRPVTSTHRRPPPPGSDPSSCSRPVLGVYDDHDSGWNNGNRRNRVKHEIKNLYLDALGEPQVRNIIDNKQK